MSGATRRGVLKATLLIGAAVLVMARPWRALRPPDLAFEEIADLAPLRRLVGTGDISSNPAGAVLIGLTPAEPPTEAAQALRTRLAADPCGALDLSSWAPGDPVPVTYFTDVRCPSCRLLEARLDALADGDAPPFRLRTREYPVFGPASEAAARIVLAGAGQGASERLRADLQRRPAPATADGVAQLADRLDLEADALVAAWRAPETTDALAEDRALARLLQLPGTPGIVIGRTIIVGAQSSAVLQAVLETEAQEGPPAVCS